MISNTSHSHTWWRRTECVVLLAGVEPPPEPGALGDLVDDEHVADDDGEVGDQLDQKELGPEHVQRHVSGVLAEVPISIKKMVKTSQE